MADHYYSKILCNKNWVTVLYIWYVAFIKSYYFLWVKVTIKQLYENMRLSTRKVIAIAFLSVQNIKRKVRQKCLIFFACCCLATTHVQVNFIAAFAILWHMCVFRQHKQPLI